MRQGRGKVPVEYSKYVMCKEMGWTPLEYDMQDRKTLIYWRLFMNLEADEADKKTRRNNKQTTKSNFR